MILLLTLRSVLGKSIQLAAAHGLRFAPPVRLETLGATTLPPTLQRSHPMKIMLVSVLTIVLFGQIAYAAHFYTTDEKGEIVAESYNPEGIAAYVFKNQQPGTVPVFRWFHAGTRDHVYTTDVNGGGAQNVGYVKDNIIAFYCYPQQSDQTIPLYSFYNSQYNDHFYTTDKNGSDDPVFKKAYKFEGPVCFSSQNRLELTQEQSRYSVGSYDSRTKITLALGSGCPDHRMSSSLSASSK